MLQLLAEKVFVFEKAALTRSVRDMDDDLSSGTTATKHVQ